MPKICPQEEPTALQYSDASIPSTAYSPLIVALSFLALLWGYNWVVKKVGVRDCNPFLFSALRNVFGGLALFAIALVRVDH